MWDVNDALWPRNLEGLFQGLVIDEAHAYRNPTSQCTIAAKWVKAKTRILMTATPVWHSHRDIMGYLSLLQTPLNIQLQSPFNYQELNDLTTGLAARSPYDPDYQQHHTINGKLDEETRRRSMTVAAFRKYAAPRKPVSQAHEALIRVFDECLVRHNYTSSLPAGKIENSIGMKLPHNIRMTRQSRFSPEWKRIFDYYGENAYKRIRMPLKLGPGAQSAGGQALGVNGNTHRHLTTVSTVPALNLVGVPKDHPCLFKSNRDRLENNRHDYLLRAQEAWIEKRRKEQERRALKEPDARWRGWPDGRPPKNRCGIPSELPFLFSPYRVARRSLLGTTQ